MWEISWVGRRSIARISHCWWFAGPAAGFCAFALSSAPRSQLSPWRVALSLLGHIFAHMLAWPGWSHIVLKSVEVGNILEAMSLVRATVSDLNNLSFLYVGMQFRIVLRCWIWCLFSYLPFNKISASSVAQTLLLSCCLLFKISSPFCWFAKHFIVRAHETPYSSYVPWPP